MNNINIKNIIGKYLLPYKRDIRINKNNMIDNLEEIIDIVNKNRYNVFINSNYFIDLTRFNLKYKTKDCNVMDLFIQNIKRFK